MQAQSDNASDMDWEAGASLGDGGDAISTRTVIDFRQSWSQLEKIKISGEPSSGGYGGMSAVPSCSDENKSQSSTSTVPKKMNSTLDVILEEKQEQGISVSEVPAKKEEVDITRVVSYGLEIPYDTTGGVVLVVSSGRNAPGVQFGGTNLELLLAKPATDVAGSSTGNTAHSFITAQERVFCCTLSMTMDGLVTSASPAESSSVVFPTKTWIGIPFVDLLHPRQDSNVFTCRHLELMGSYDLGNASIKSEIRLSCRVRRNKNVSWIAPTYAPVHLILKVERSTGAGRQPTFHINAFLYKSYFTTPNEVVDSAPPIVMRQAPTGTIDQISEEAVQLLGYLPQQVIDDNVLLLCHENDLKYLKLIYLTMIREGIWPRSKCQSFRMRCQNGCYVKLEAEWTCSFNPQTKRVDSVFAKLYVVMGPEIPDVFKAPAPPSLKQCEIKNFLNRREWTSTELLRDSIVRILTYWTPTTQQSGGLVESGKCRPNMKLSDDEEERNARGGNKGRGKNKINKSLK